MFYPAAQKMQDQFTLKSDRVLARINFTYIISLFALANEIELSLNYLNNQGKFNAKHGNNKVHIDLEYNGEKAKFVGEYLHDPIRNLYGLKGKMETTIPKLEKAAFEVEHLFEKVGDKTILSQKVIFFLRIVKLFLF